MDAKAFETITKAMGIQMTRRGTMARLVAGIAAGVTGVAITSDALEAKRKKRGKGKVRSQAQAGKVAICHFASSESNSYEIITVSSNAFDAHKKHGDFEYVDCCKDSECQSGTCDKGTCVATNTCPVVNAPSGEACFWLDCFSGPGCCWNLNGAFAATQADCQNLDSCNAGGGGASGGGCYKWATSSTTQIAPPWS